MFMQSGKIVAKIQREGAHGFDEDKSPPRIKIDPRLVHDEARWADGTCSHVTHRLHEAMVFRRSECPGARADRRQGKIKLSASEHQIEDKHDQQNAADTDAAAVSPPGIPETAPEEEEQNDNNQDQVHPFPPFGFRNPVWGGCHGHRAVSDVPSRSIPQRQSLSVIERGSREG